MPHPSRFRSLPSARASKHAHSYYAEDLPSSPRSSPNETSRYLKPKEELLGPQFKISHHLSPLISKFEDMDTIHQETQVASFRPLPLQISRKATCRRGGFDGPTSMNLDAISSPRSEHKRIAETALVEKMAASLPENSFVYDTLKRLELRRSIPSNPENSTRLRDNIFQERLPAGKECEYPARIPTYTEDTRYKSERSRKNSVVKERIKLFDECAEFTKITALSETDGSRQKKISTYRTSPQTLAKSTLPVDIKSQRSARQNDSNLFSQAPHTRSQSRHIPPTTISTSEVADKRQASKVPPGKVRYSLKKGVLRQENGPRPHVQNLLTNPKTMIAKSLDNDVMGTQNRWKLEALIEAEPERKESKYNDMSMLREKSLVAKSLESGPWSFCEVKGKKPPKPRWRDSSRPASPESPTRAFPSINPPRNLFTNPNLLDIDSKIRHIPVLVGQEKDFLATPPEAAPEGTYNRIKRWESALKSRERDEVAARGNHYSKRVNSSVASRNTVCENGWSDYVGKQLGKRGLSGGEVEVVMGEFEDIGASSEDDTKGTWKMVVGPRLSRGGPSQNDGELDESGDIDMRIIVREAQCGLAEPKPLRLLEMKRMILLCRERILVGKQRGNG